jgi:hypothetical protein
MLRVTSNRKFLGAVSNRNLDDSESRSQIVPASAVGVCSQTRISGVRRHRRMHSIVFCATSVKPRKEWQ